MGLGILVMVVMLSINKGNKQMGILSIDFREIVGSSGFRVQHFFLFGTSDQRYSICLETIVVRALKM